VVREALGTGASGYIVKSDAGRELLAGVKAALQDELFVGQRFSGHDFVGVSHPNASPDLVGNGSTRAQL
jgi:DNA-binding NarL/FixJ family response regulator